MSGEHEQSNAEQIKRWKLKLLLDENYSWPTEYLFKFIVPELELPLLKKILIDECTFEKTQLMEKNSSHGKYVSVTAKKIFQNSEDVLVIYEKVKQVQGLVAL